MSSVFQVLVWQQRSGAEAVSLSFWSTEVSMSVSSNCCANCCPQLSCQLNSQLNSPWRLTIAQRIYSGILNDWKKCVALTENWDHGKHAGNSGSIFPLRVPQNRRRTWRKDFIVAVVFHFQSLHLLKNPHSSMYWIQSVPGMMLLIIVLHLLISYICWNKVFILRLEF